MSPSKLHFPYNLSSETSGSFELPDWILGCCCTICILHTAYRLMMLEQINLRILDRLINEWEINLIIIENKWALIYKYDICYNNVISKNKILTFLFILKICSLQYLPSSSLLKNNLPLDLKRSNSLSYLKIDY